METKGGKDQFKDYDAAAAEVEDRWQEFKFGGEHFKVNVNVDGSIILNWMENAQAVSSMVTLLKAIMGEDEYKRLLATRQPWAKYEMLLTDLFSLLGGPGNQQ
jgi:hypothetical protein